jgi:hypothetical protein
MAAALRHAGRTEHATRCCGRTGRSGSHQAAVRGLPGRVATAWSGSGWQPSGQRCHRRHAARQQCAPSRHRARTRRSETRRPDRVCSRSVIGAPPDRSAHSRRSARLWVRVQAGRRLRQIGAIYAATSGRLCELVAGLPPVARRGRAPRSAPSSRPLPAAGSGQGAGGRRVAGRVQLFA